MFQSLRIDTVRCWLSSEIQIRKALVNTNAIPAPHIITHPSAASKSDYGWSVYVEEQQQRLMSYFKEAPSSSSDKDVPKSVEASTSIGCTSETRLGDAGWVVPSVAHAALWQTLPCDVRWRKRPLQLCKADNTTNIYSICIPTSEFLLCVARLGLKRVEPMGRYVSQLV